MKRLLLIAFTAIAPVALATPVSATAITFSEPSVVSLMTRTFIGTRVFIFSDHFPTFSLSGATFAATGSTSLGSPNVLLRDTFDDRSPAPYPYDFIDGNLMQVASTGLDISFATPTNTFRFGAAIDSTISPATMQIELLGIGNASLGLFTLTLDRTVLSTHGGTNSNSEGLFVAPNVGPITGARLRNFGDGTSNGSQYHWVIDNIEFQGTTVPEPMSLLLVGAGLVAGTMRARRRRS